MCVTICGSCSEREQKIKKKFKKINNKTELQFIVSNTKKKKKKSASVPVK